MTVQELIDALLKVEDKTRLVICQKDSEGNSFSPLEGIDDNCKYIAENKWNGEILIEKLTPELKKQGFTKEDTTKKGKKALVLYPIY